MNTDKTIKHELVEQIILKEYAMFSNVKNVGERASCQDDFRTFYIMRFAQHSIFGIHTLKRYQEDIRRAVRENRNMAAEKYAWMMEETDQSYFLRELKPYLPEVSEKKAGLVEAMTAAFMTCYELVRQHYPNLLSAGRDPYGNDTGASIRLYFSGELKTWSEDTLCLACQDVIRHLEKRCNPVGMIYEKIIELENETAG
ncbi:MAG: DUF4125 family protein [Lachnospiraceae bacterium]